MFRYTTFGMVSDFTVVPVGELVLAFETAQVDLQFVTQSFIFMRIAVK